MPTKDDFDAADALPRFLAARTEQGTENAPDGAVAASPFLKATVAIAAAIAVGIAVLAVGNPMALFAEDQALLVGNSPPPSTPIIQSAVDASAPVPSTPAAEASPPTTGDALTRDDIAASESAGKNSTDISELASEDLFRQFQAWAAEQDAQVRGEPMQPIQDAPAAEVVQTAPAPAAENVRVPQRFVQKRRPVRAVRNARAEMRAQNLRRQARQTQSERAERPPIRDARAQDQPVQAQDASAPSFLSIFGPRN
jgi:hypothetical protein